MPDVSVIIPTYNRSELARVAIQSVLNQTYAGFEMIVVDDGSSDDTGSVVRGISDPRLHYYRQDNAGLAAARNAGIRAAHGQYVAFLDDDDFWYPEALASQMAVFAREPSVGLVAGGWLAVDAVGQPMRVNRPWIEKPDLGSLTTWLKACPVVVSAVLVRKAWLETVGGFDERLRRLACEDYDLWLRLAHSGCQMAWNETIVCAIRFHPTSMSRNSVRQGLSTVQVLETYFHRSDLPAEVQGLKSSIMANAHLRAAARAYCGCQYQMAENNVAEAVRLDPHLLDDRGEQLYQALIGWVGDPIVDDAVAYVNNIFTHLPAGAAVLHSRRRQAVASAAKSRLFLAHYQHNAPRYWQSIRILAANDPRLLLDRGIASTLVDRLLGARISSQIKHTMKGLAQWQRAH